MYDNMIAKWVVCEIPNLATLVSSFEVRSGHVPVRQCLRCRTPAPQTTTELLKISANEKYEK